MNQFDLFRTLKDADADIAIAEAITARLEGADRDRAMAAFARLRARLRSAIGPVAYDGPFAPRGPGSSVRMIPGNQIES